MLSCWRATIAALTTVTMATTSSTVISATPRWRLIVAAPLERLGHTLGAGQCLLHRLLGGIGQAQQTGDAAVAGVIDIQLHGDRQAFGGILRAAAAEIERRPFLVPHGLLVEVAQLQARTLSSTRCTRGSLSMSRSSTTQ